MGRQNYKTSMYIALHSAVRNQCLASLVMLILFVMLIIIINLKICESGNKRVDHVKVEGKLYVTCGLIFRLCILTSIHQNSKNLHLRRFEIKKKTSEDTGQLAEPVESLQMNNSVSTIKRCKIVCTQKIDKAN